MTAACDAQPDTHSVTQEKGERERAQMREERRSGRRRRRGTTENEKGSSISTIAHICGGGVGTF